MKRFCFRFYNFATDNSTLHSLKLFGVSVWAFYRIKGFWWFRIFGRGFTCKNTDIYEKSFSERNGYTKNLRIGKWLIGVLK